MRGVTFTSERVMLSCVFQPALPMRGVTQFGKGLDRLTIDFNPHSPCGE